MSKCKRKENEFTFWIGNCDYYVTAPYVNVTEGLARKVSNAVGKTVWKGYIQKCHKETKNWGIILRLKEGCIVIPYADMQGKYKELEINI